MVALRIVIQAEESIVADSSRFLRTIAEELQTWNGLSPGDSRLHLLGLSARTRGASLNGDDMSWRLSAKGATPTNV